MTLWTDKNDSRLSVAVFKKLPALPFRKGK